MPFAGQLGRAKVSKHPHPPRLLSDRGPRLGPLPADLLHEVVTAPEARQTFPHDEEVIHDVAEPPPDHVASHSTAAFQVPARPLQASRPLRLVHDEPAGAVQLPAQALVVGRSVGLLVNPEADAAELAHDQSLGLLHLLATYPVHVEVVAVRQDAHPAQDVREWPGVAELPVGPPLEGH